jgi:LysM repeat protein
MDNRDYSCMVYVIKSGDTLYSISRENNVPIALILRANPYADIYNLQVDDELCIPVMNQVTWNNISAYVTKDGDSLQSVMDKFGLGLNEILEFNNVDQIMLTPGTTVQVPTYEEDVNPTPKV